MNKSDLNKNFDEIIDKNINVIVKKFMEGESFLKIIMSEKKFTISWKCEWIFLQNEPKTLFLSKLVSVVKRRWVAFLKGEYFVTESSLLTKYDTRLIPFNKF